MLTSATLSRSRATKRASVTRHLLAASRSKNVVHYRQRMHCAMVHAKSAQSAALVTLFFLSQLTFSHASEEEHKLEDEHHSLNTSSVWGYSFLFTFVGCLPSACAIVICLCFRMSISGKVISSMMAFASGVLIGGSLFHLLPDIAENSSQELSRGLTCIVLVVISVMVMLESFAELKGKSVNQTKNQVHSAAELQNVSHNDGPPAYAVSIAPSSDAAKKQPDSPQLQHQLSYAILLQQPDVLVNLMGEALHNLCDGIAISAAFTLSWESGIATFAAVIIHEIPQELSDVVIISKAGGTWKQCLVLNSLIACTSFIGVIIGASVAASSETANKVLVAINAGCFIHLGFRLSLSHIIPQVSNRIDIAAHVIVFNVGWISMLVLTYVEEAFGAH